MDGAEVAATKNGIPPSRVFGRPHFRDFLGSFVSPLVSTLLQYFVGTAWL
jgi:hypothetical protein